MIDDIDYVQGADTMFIAHPSVPIYRLRRQDHDDWSLAAAPFVVTPFNEIGFGLATTLTLSGAAVGAGRTLTAGSATFLASDVGRCVGRGGYRHDYRLHQLDGSHCRHRSRFLQHVDCPGSGRSKAPQAPIVPSAKTRLAPRSPNFAVDHDADCRGCRGHHRLIPRRNDVGHGDDKQSWLQHGQHDPDRRLRPGRLQRQLLDHGRQCQYLHLSDFP